MSVNLRLRLLSRGFALLVSSIACQQTLANNQPAMNLSDSKDWDAYVNEFLEAYFVARPDLPCARAGMSLMGSFLIGREACKSNPPARQKDLSVLFRILCSASGNASSATTDSIVDADLFWLESASAVRCPQFYADAIDGCLCLA